MGLWDTITQPIARKTGDYFNSGIETVAGAVGTGIDYLLHPTSSTYNYKGTSAPVPTKAPANPGKSAYDTQMASLDAQIAALKYQTQQNTLNSFFNPNYTALYSQAQKNVNPYFENKWNQYLTQFNQQRDYRTTQRDLAIQSLQDKLAQQTEQTGIEQQRTTQDVAQNLLDITKGENIRQTSEGRQFDEGRRNLQSQLGEAGLTQSGLGKQQLQSAQLNRRDTEQAQKMQVEQKQRTQKLFEERTIGDLTRNLDWAKKGTETSKKQEEAAYNMDLSELLFKQTQQQYALDEERFNRIQQEQQNLANIEYQKYFRGLKNNTQRTLAGQVYGSRYNA